MDDLEKLFNALPTEISQRIKDKDELIEIVIDLGRPLEFRYCDDSIEIIEDFIVHPSHIRKLENSLGKFNDRNRSGINGTLHRISKITDREGDTVGFTVRIGKPFIGSIDLIKDFLEAGKNILLLGPPGAGKTSRLRDAARYLSNNLLKRVVIVDESNEIAGDGKIPHSAVGRSRRLQVPPGKTQGDVIIEAVENHMPEVIVVDEIGTYPEAQSARTIAQRGVQLVATAHGKTLEDLMENPPLVDLVGGINIVTLSDDQAKNRNLHTKTIPERKHRPTFDVLVELVEFDIVKVYSNLESSVDTILAGGFVRPEERRLLDGIVKTVQTEKLSLPIVKEEVIPTKTRRKNG